MLIDRTIGSQVKDAVFSKNKAVVLYGPRQAGKTTLLNLLFPGSKNTAKFSGDDLYVQRTFATHELEVLKKAVGNSEIIIIDEAQRIENIGLSIKLIVDNLPATVLASGSASFELAGKLNEPLTGRTKTFHLFPLSYAEAEPKYTKTLQKTALEEMLRFGMYPKVHVMDSDAEKQDYLNEYINNYLYKDIAMFEGVRKPQKAVDLLTLLALQIGKEVSISELAQNLAISQKAVLNYLDVFEKMFVIKNLRGFSRNLRKEISKTSKYYFVDVGVRNALIRNFNRLNVRSDAGELFENWFIMEKFKFAANSREAANFYFWRTYDRQEIDLVEEKAGRLTAYECKFSSKKNPSVPADWASTYPGAGFKTVNQENFAKLFASF